MFRAVGSAWEAQRSSDAAVRAEMSFMFTDRSVYLIKRYNEYYKRTDHPDSTRTFARYYSHLHGLHGPSGILVVIGRYISKI